MSPEMILRAHFLLNDFFALAAVITRNIFVSTRRRKVAKEFLPQGKEATANSIAEVTGRCRCYLLQLSLSVGRCVHFVTNSSTSMYLCF